MPAPATAKDDDRGGHSVGLRVTIPLLIFFTLAIILTGSYLYLRYRRRLDFFCTRPSTCSRHHPCTPCRIIRRYSFRNYKNITHKYHLAALKRERLELTVEQTRRSFFDGLIEGRMSRVMSGAYSLSRNSSKRSTASKGGGDRVFKFDWKDGGGGFRRDGHQKRVEDMRFDEALMMANRRGEDMVEIPKAAYAAYSFGERGSITDPYMTMGRGMGREAVGMERGEHGCVVGDPGPATPYCDDTPFSAVACPGAWVRSPMDAVPRLPSMNFNHHFSVFDEYGDEYE